MAAKLAEKSCKACQGQEERLEGRKLHELREQLDAGWNLVDEHHLEKEFLFDDYKSAVDFTNTVAGIAQEEDHHPDIMLTYGKVGVTVWTHKVEGLTESDFVFAAKVEEASQKQ